MDEWAPGQLIGKISKYFGEAQSPHFVIMSLCTNQMSRTEFEDELEYNISRKEKLKEDVKNLVKENKRKKEENRKH